MIHLKEAPFNLNESEIDWVKTTLASMTLEEKVGQVFCPLGPGGEEFDLHHMIDDLHVGGLMYRPDFAANIQDTHRKIQKMAKIPLLLAANVERGGDGVCLEGTSFGRPMAVAASGDKGNAYRMGVAACKEGAAVGLNWAFAPFVDIDMEFHNPITNVRTFGSNVDQIIEYASEYLHAADENDVAVSIKHFPGDGTDERDQHLVTSVNTLSTDDWDESYGRIYRTLIECGAKNSDGRPHCATGVGKEN